ncbi:MAG: nucleotidyltransferase domain-containing protein [Candidatus Margulisbacteria bacterium]|jgi:predicted nucleotidyltransferase|nr:nucleotidyltransferase domain-containing protein [Candidatus Margulisiibacteriota bacterium]
MSITIEENHLLLIRKILANSDFRDAAVYIFGSRATGKARQYSDLDIAVDNFGQPLPPRTLLRLSIDFDNSLLPYKVDVVDLNNISPEFQSIIKKDLVRFN